MMEDLRLCEHKFKHQKKKPTPAVRPNKLPVIPHVYTGRGMAYTILHEHMD